LRPREQFPRERARESRSHDTRERPGESRSSRGTVGTQSEFWMDAS